MLEAMQYFQLMSERDCPKRTATAKSKLLFYLVTCLFAQWLSSRRAANLSCKVANEVALGLVHLAHYYRTLLPVNKYRIING